MDNLTVIENELVPVYITDKGEKVVYGKELHKVLAVKTDFSAWVKRRLNDCDASEETDYDLLPKIEEHVSGAKHSIDYVIKLDIAKEMAMLERNKKGKEVRRYFIRIEEKYKEGEVHLTLQQQIQTIAKGTDELYKRVDEVTEDVKSVKEEIEALKDDLPLFPSEAEKISNAVKKKGVEVMGGKQSPAYKDKSLQHKVYANIYSNLKYNFNVDRYKDIKRGNRNKAVEIVNEYQPPFFLAEQIANTNAQQTFNLEGGAAQ